MGGEILLKLTEIPDVNVRCILFDKEKRIPRFTKNIIKKNKDKVSCFTGDIARYEDCEKLIENADYVINCASIIPPKSDHDHLGAYLSCYLGTKNIVDAIKASGREIAYVHIATVAMYGHRAYPHVWGRVGDPMISSDYDAYSTNKLKAELYVLEGGLTKFVSLRQTGILHKYMFANNLKDGLMFHSAWNSPLEWVTDRDSGVLCANLVHKDIKGELKGFWNKIYNIGGGESCRITCFESIDGCFKLMGKGAKKIFKPNWNILRNFHGVWFYDGDSLEKILNFRHESVDDFWERMVKTHPYFKLGAIVPSALISKFLIKRLFKNTNAPMYWIKHKKDGRVKAFFGGYEEFEKTGEDWNKFPLLCERADYAEIKDIKNAKNYLLDHGYDDFKPDEDLSLSDLKSAAAFRGGECLEKAYSYDKLYKKAKWKCREGHEFEATPYTILKGGYWCPCCTLPPPYRYGALAKDIPFYGQVYFDTHSEEECEDVYPLDEHEDDFLLN